MLVEKFSLVDVLSEQWSFMLLARQAPHLHGVREVYPLVLKSFRCDAMLAYKLVVLLLQSATCQHVNMSELLSSRVQLANPFVILVGSVVYRRGVWEQTDGVMGQWSHLSLVLLFLLAPPLLHLLAEGGLLAQILPETFTCALRHSELSLHLEHMSQPSAGSVEHNTGVKRAPQPPPSLHQAEVPTTTKVASPGCSFRLGMTNERSTSASSWACVQNSTHTSSQLRVQHCKLVESSRGLSCAVVLVSAPSFLASVLVTAVRASMGPPPCSGGGTTGGTKAGVCSACSSTTRRSFSCCKWRRSDSSLARDMLDSSISAPSLVTSSTSRSFSDKALLSSSVGQRDELELLLRLYQSELCTVMDSYHPSVDTTPSSWLSGDQTPPGSYLSPYRNTPDRAYFPLVLDSAQACELGEERRTQPRGGGNTRALHELSCEPAISQSDLSACVERSLLVAQSRGTHSSSPSGVGARHHGLIFCNNSIVPSNDCGACDSFPFHGPPLGVWRSTRTTTLCPCPAGSNLHRSCLAGISCKLLVMTALLTRRLIGRELLPCFCQKIDWKRTVTLFLSEQ
uniref:Uncharacterized protein n=1 Tax=Timema genevievae TaxID=629358 RepID=A0A7R9K0M2_TIMGE|nr:unnamed protein product [Timema genevievae]